MTGPITVLGGTGKSGRRITDRLRRLGYDARPLGRTSTPRFEWTEPPTWRPALARSRAVYLVGAPYRLDATDLLTELVSTALDPATERLVLLSARGIEAAGPTALTAETAVRDSGRSWTVLRPAWFAQTFTEDFGAPGADDTIRLPLGDGAHPYVELADVAEVAVAALTSDEHHGRVYELSGQAPLTGSDVAAALTAAGGQPVSYAPIDRASFVATRVAEGISPAYAELLGDLMDLIARGWDAHLSTGVSDALGRPATAVLR
ncbi:NAD(P)H-binding protein [Natronosporangium hydrolyticum]|uniref:NAD(P)H-binding protein n=1 Tax=Natronosporangium hydrolyticum TaxID=2811111 RepID=A0A895YIZ4_9ACTN|nr:NAD(P)H-binding protein [Natronosporangium hydrolyticum]QSB14100.1 NAD(P)H-binding protein [Natronosporangium hydrolyticum]